MTAEKRKGKESEIFCEVKEPFTENLCTLEDHEGEALLSAAVYTVAQEGAGAAHDSSDIGTALAPREYILRRTGAGALGVRLSAYADRFEVGGVYVFSFKARAESYRTATVQLHDGLGEVICQYTYKLNCQLTELSLPFKVTVPPEDISILVDGTLGDCALSDFRITRSDSQTVQGASHGYSMVKDGSWVMVDADLTASRIKTARNCTDVAVTADGYIYALACGTLQVFKENGTPHPDPISTDTPEALGEVRQLSICEERGVLALVARSAGVFIYDISDRECPKRVCHLDTLEMATGIDINGNYLYIADRLFGVSIYGIENSSAPEYICSINAGECQDVTYYNGYLYCGIWGGMKVRIYDVRRIDSPCHVYDIALSGRGDGVTLSGNMLYAATGHHEPKESTTESIGYGMGNGMEIWDIKDPSAPVLQSIVRCDGRAYDNSPDIWRITLADRYAFLSCSYSGLYVFDVSDPKAPVRKAHINVTAKCGEEGYRDFNTRPTFVFPYDTKQKMNAPIIDCDVSCGILYIAGHSSALHTLPLELVTGTHRPCDSTVMPKRDVHEATGTHELKSLGLKNPKLLSTGAQLWSIKVVGNYLYAAAGREGIYVLDPELNILNRVKTSAPCHDLTTDGKVIYTAESTDGLGIYYIDRADGRRVTRHSVTNVGGALTQAVLAPGGRFVLCQMRNSGALLDVSCHDSVKIYEKYPYPMFYQRQISIQPAANRYLWCYSTGRKGVIIDFGKDGESQAPTSRIWENCVINYYAGGITALGDCFAVANNGKIYFVDPQSDDTYSAPFSECGTYKWTYPTALSLGAPEIIGDYLFIFSRLNGSLSVYKWDAKESTPAENAAADRVFTGPTHIITVKTGGNPTAPVMLNNRVFLPLGYKGILAFDL